MINKTSKKSDYLGFLLIYVLCFVCWAQFAILSKTREFSAYQRHLGFNGVIKSLGAWVGDFILVIAKENPSGYFKERGFRTIVSYKDMIL